jgi:hypothetical protein
MYPVINFQVLAISKVKDLKAIIHQKLRGLCTYHSNAIEGSTLSLGGTLFFLIGKMNLILLREAYTPVIIRIEERAEMYLPFLATQLKNLRRNHLN